MLFIVDSCCVLGFRKWGGPGEQSWLETREMKINHLHAESGQLL